MTEEQIIEGCQRQNRACQRALVEGYSRRLLTVARRYVGDPGAKDILQEAFIRIFKNIKRYRHQGSFEGWMRTIVINLALNTMDKARFRKEVHGLERLPVSTTPPDIDQRLDAEDLLALIQQLPEGYRQIFNLAAIEGYTHKEIGQLLGISTSSSRSQLSRARAKLQAMISHRESYCYATK